MFSATAPSSRNSTYVNKKPGRLCLQPGIYVPGNRGDVCQTKQAITRFFIRTKSLPHKGSKPGVNLELAGWNWFSLHATHLLLCQKQLSKHLKPAEKKFPSKQAALRARLMVPSL